MQLSDDAIEVLRLLVEACKFHGIELVLIGASSLIVHSQSSSFSTDNLEATRDIDAVTSALSWDEYDALIDQLIQKGFTRDDQGIEHRLRYKETNLDILPYGEHLLEGDSLVWRVSGNRMNIHGLKEALLLAKPFEVGNNLKVLVPPPWLIVYLKVVAYLDQPQARTKDIRDILTILKYFEDDPRNTRRFDLEADLVYELRGAYLIGRDMANNLNQAKLEPVYSLLNEVELDDSVIISRALCERPIMQADEAFRLFDAMKRGLLISD